MEVPEADWDGLCAEMSAHDWDVAQRDAEQLEARVLTQVQLVMACAFWHACIECLCRRSLWLLKGSVFRSGSAAGNMFYRMQPASNLITIWFTLFSIALLAVRSSGCG